MGFLVSPGVEVKEIDLTNVIPAVSTSIGGFSGRFKWGPVGELVTVSSENDLAETFGKPDSNSSSSFLQAASFLKYGNTLRVSRAVSEHNSPTVEAGDATFTATVGTANGAPTSTQRQILVKNLTDFEGKTVNSALFGLARCPGDLGNSLKILIGRTSSSYDSSNNNIVNDGTQADAKRLFAANFDAAPGSVSTVSSDDEIHVLIVDEDGLISGTKNNVLEKFQGLSLASDAKKDDGSSNYYFDVINNRSAFIYINKLGNLYTGADDTVANYDAGTATIANATGSSNSPVTHENGNFTGGLLVESFLAGQDGTLTSASFTADDSGLGLFSDSESVDVNLLFAEAGQLADAAQIVVDQKVMNIATTRKDVVGFVSAPVDSVNGLQYQTSEANKLTKVTDRKTSLGAMDSYHFMDSTPVYVYNKYFDRFDYIAANGHIAGLCANTDNVADSWFSPAGLNRGTLRQITKLAFNPKQAARDDLYKANINPVVSFPGQGVLLFGDKTGQSKPSAFDRINVRRLFITLEKAIATAAKFQLFELNDEFTRAQFRNLIEPFLRDVKGRRGITDFLVVCDETNNTGQVIDTNRFVADIYIKPARSINFITLNFVATRTGIDFSEVVGSSQ